jgi:hypothetical protein
VRVKLTVVTSRILLSGLFIALTAIVIVSFGMLPKRLLEYTVPLDSLTAVQQASAESAIRGSLLQAVGGILLVIGAITAWRQFLLSRKQHILDRHIATTEAFTKAVEYIGNPDAMNIRIGGIYSLDRVADDDPAERSRVLNVLTAYIRERSPSQGDIPRDVQTALTVLVNRQWPAPLDLSSIYLHHARLAKALLTDARLSGVDLSGAFLNAAKMQNVDLTGADLRNADLKGADLRGACLLNARMSGAIADSTTLWPTDFVPTDHGVLIR